MFGWGPTLYYLRVKRVFEVKKFERRINGWECHILLGAGLTRHEANELLAKLQAEDPDNSEKYSISMRIAEEVNEDGWTKEQLRELERKENEP